jgi:alpha-ribazole phosphatase/probable phosphoglycerate mutase
MAGTFCGHSDPPLNARGQQQVAHIISSLIPESFDEIYSSDLLRATETAARLSQAFSAPVTATDSLREIHFGDWEGLTWTEIESRDAEYAGQWLEAFPALPAPNGEDFASFEARVLQEVDQLLSLAKARRIAVVTHGGVMRAVLRTLLVYDEQRAWEMTKPYCSSFDCIESILSQRRIR